jgi:hypothetical protein
MKKSPLNINIAGAVGSAIGAGGRKGILKRIDRTTQKIARLIPRPGATGPVDTNANVGITDNIVPNDPASSLGLQPPNQAFPPGTETAAGEMFGQPMDQSFDRDMGMGIENIEEEIF